MKILVISDTHIPHRAKSLPKEFYDKVEDVDAIIHAGDFTSVDVLREMEGFKPLYAVYGNMDDADVYSLLPEIRVEEFEGVKVGIFHGVGSPLGIEKKVFQKFKNENMDVDIVIFGHSHRWFYGEMEGVKLLNPGSATDKFFSFKRSFAILTIENGDISVEKVRVD